jgi:hypothetical protein
MKDYVSEAVVVNTGADEALVFCRCSQGFVVLSLSYRANGDAALPLETGEASKLVEMLLAATAQPPGEAHMTPENRANRAERTVLRISWGDHVRLSFRTDNESPIYVDLTADQIRQVVNLLKEAIAKLNAT